MLWDLDHEEKGYAVETLLRRGQPVPDWYLACPYVPPAAEWVHAMFWRLSSDRVELGPIPYGSVLRYCRHKGLDDAMTEIAAQLCRRMDRAYLERMSAKMKAAMKSHG